MVRHEGVRGQFGGFPALVLRGRLRYIGAAGIVAIPAFWRHRASAGVPWLDCWTGFLTPWKGFAKSCRQLLPSLPAMVDGHLIGRGDLVIEGAAPLRDAQPGQITLVDGGEKNQNLADCRAAAVIAPRSFTPRRCRPSRWPDAHRAFAAVVAFFQPRPPPRRIGVSPLAAVSPTAKLGADVDVHPLCHHRRRRDDRRRLDDPLRRAHHGRLADRRERDHLPQRRALRKHGRRPALR